VAALLRAYLVLAAEQAETPPLVFAGRLESPVAALASGHERSELFRTHVRFLGYVSDDERLRLYREASMLVIASADEGFGIPALEAMTIGLPVVAAARGSLPEVLGDAGILVDADDTVAFSRAMLRLIQDASLRRDQAAKGVNRARRFNWDDSAARLRAAFANALDRKARRS
jgi:glycosyltransferase involved in cell wall biosynthesis